MSAEPPLPTTFSMWVVYDHPLDYPDSYVVREWMIGPNGVLRTGAVYIRPYGPQSVRLICLQCASKELSL